MTLLQLGLDLLHRLQADTGLGPFKSANQFRVAVIAAQVAER